MGKVTNNEMNPRTVLSRIYAMLETPQRNSYTDDDVHIERLEEVLRRARHAIVAYALGDEEEFRYQEDRALRTRQEALEVEHEELGGGPR